MSNDKPLMIPAEIYDEMGIDNDDHLQFDYDAGTRTLRIHVLTQEELDSLAGYKEQESECGRCVFVSTCPDAYGPVHPCAAFIAKEEDW